MESVQVRLSFAEDMLKSYSLPHFSVTGEIIDQVTQKLFGNIIIDSVRAKEQVLNRSDLQNPSNVKTKRPSGNVSSGCDSKKSKTKGSNLLPVASQIKVSVPSLGPKVDVSSQMTVMQNMTTKETTYKCSYCGSETKLLSSMKRHIESKHLPTSTVFNCRTCEYSTKYKHDLKKHYMSRHGMPEPAAQAMIVAMI